MTLAEKHIWLIETIRRAGRISLEDLSQKWMDNEELSCHKPLLRCKFNRWRDQILIQYGIDIQCEKGGQYRYFIANPEEFEDSKLKKWMLDSIGVGNIIAGNKCLNNRIVVDEIPSGRDFLMPILTAMKENKVVNLTYQSYGRDAHSFSISPYCIKLYQNRWYVLGNGTDKRLRLYGLDRIKALELTDRKFDIPRDFNAEDYFALHFGVVLHDHTKPCTVLLRAYGNHVNYIRSLPLHQSQQEVHTEGGEYSDFKYFLAPTYDFILAILGIASMVEVLEPATLREEITNWVRDLADMYLNNKSKMKASI